MTAMSEFAVTFPSAGRPPYLLEGLLSRPGEIGADRQYAGAVLCHPQPISSTMRDPLLEQLAHDLAGSGVVALRFNFRGVGASEGQQTDGRLEPLDIAGAIECILSQPDVNPDKICLIGHAFGGYMALTYAAHDPRVRTLVAVSPPVVRISPELGAFDRPKLFVTGEYDEVSPRHKLETWIQRLPGGRALRVVTGARHLMRGFEPIASDTIVKYVTKWAATPGV